jgi:guanylate kinase
MKLVVDLYGNIKKLKIMKKSEKAILIGKSGSGKDYLMRKLVEKGLKPCLKWTTRPPRKFEKQGVTYNFVKDEEFIQAIDESKFLSYQKFEVTPEGKSPETWYYGVTNEEFESSQILIMTPAETKNIKPELRKGCFLVYLDIPREVRESRLFRREDKNDSIKRRLDADEIDFFNFSDYDLKITDPEFSPEDVWDLME